MAIHDIIDNLHLIENGLHHIQYELSREPPSYFRIARETHMILYRSMIETLKETGNRAITHRPKKDRQHIYQIGNKPWQEIHKVSVKGCNKAWRFSEPVICPKPETQSTIRSNQKTKKNDQLIPFYDALAKIQNECFMEQFVFSKIANISDEQMKIFEWLHEEIRNVYEHFIPSSYMSPVNQLVMASIECLNLSKELLFDSRNVSFLEEDQEDTLKHMLADISNKLNLIQERIKLNQEP